jgi:hypothetical protein
MPISTSPITFRREIDEIEDFGMKDEECALPPARRSSHILNEELRQNLTYPPVAITYSKHRSI